LRLAGWGQLAIVCASLPLLASCHILEDMPLLRVGVRGSGLNELVRHLFHARIVDCRFLSLQVDGEGLSLLVSVLLILAFLGIVKQ
jgi:hypothetical protein